MALKLSENEKLALINHIINSEGWGDQISMLNRIKEIVNDE